MLQNFFWIGFWVIWVTGLFMILTYGWVIFFGAPYIPTLKKQQRQAIKLINLKKGQVFVDLGCGDGGLLILAAERGWKVIGYELNPFLALVAWARTRRFGRQVKVKFGSFWRADLSSADGVFVFLIGHYMAKLDSLISNQPHKRLKVVSNAFAIPRRKLIKKRGAMFLYQYPDNR